MGLCAEQPFQSTPDSHSLEVEPHLTSTAKRQKTEHQTMAEASPDGVEPPQTTTSTSTSTPTSTSILESLHLEHTPSSHSVHVAVFRDVENAAFLHQQLLARNTDFEYAFIDAGVITSRLQVLGAAFKAISAQVGGVLKTPNVHSETVCSLSPAPNIAEAYRRYGITPTSRDLVVVKVLVASPGSGPESDAGAKRPSSAQDVEKHLLAHVRGRPVPFTDQTLSELTDWGRVRKYYKLNGVGWLDGMKDKAAKNREMDMLVVGGMALRGV